MPYQAGQRLGGESASKLGHLDVLNSEFVNDVVIEFEKPEISEDDYNFSNWETAAAGIEPLKYIFAVDGSLQILKSGGNPKREIAFVKTALLHLDPHVISQIDPEYPHPNQLRKVMTETALYHATVFPLKNINMRGSQFSEGIRKLIFDSFQDPTLDGEPYDTLKWLLYKKWDPSIRSNSPAFDCPECCEEQSAGFSFDSDTGKCKSCGAKLYVTDVIGLHLEMTEESAAESLATAYMLIHETMLLLTAIRIFWEMKNFKVLSNTLFLKDGPLTLRGQYAKLVPNIRDFLTYARSKEIIIHICGQEKTGKFVDYLQGISRLIEPKKNSDPPRFSILPHNFIRKEIQRIRDSKNPYGYRTNYGEKVLLKQNPHHFIVLNIPSGQYLDDETKPDSRTDLIGIDRIIATIPQMLSYRHECALVPIELVNGIASLSSYPSAKVLKLFSGLE